MFSFFKKIDLYLLRNFPNFWSTRIHKLLLFWLLGFGLLTGIFMIQSIDSYTSSGEEYIYPWLFLLIICGIIFWMVFLFRFNLFKSFGKRPWLDEYQNFLIIFMGIFLLVGSYKTMDTARFLKVRITIPDSKLINGINAVNSFESYKSGVALNSFKICPGDFSNKEEFEIQKNENIKAYESYELDSEGCYIFANFEFNENYTGRMYYGRDDNKPDPGILGPAQIYRKLQRLRTKSDSIAFLDTICAGIAGMSNWKFTGKDLYEDAKRFHMQSYYEQTLDPGESEAAQYTAARKRIENAKEYRHFFHGYRETEVEFRMWFYASFMITLLILIFRNMTRKTFLVSIATAALMPLLVVVTILITGGFKGDENRVFVILFGYYLIFAIMSGSILVAKTRNIFQGIALNLFTLSSPFLFLFIRLWSFEANNNFDENGLRSAEMWGIIVFLILLQPVFKFLYTRWYSLPEQ